MTAAASVGSAARLERMRRAVAAHAAAGNAPVHDARAGRPRRGAVADDALALTLRGEWRETPHGPIFVRDDWYPPDYLHGRLPLSAPLAAPAAALAALVRGDAPHASKLAFFDIETTGLAGGTGTYVILAGLGSFEEGAFRLRQYFLPGPAQEHAMLAALAEDLARFEGVVTYNGKAFDIPFVEARLTLARIASPCGGLAHIDLLHPVRRLYKHRMPGCRLAEAERRLLRFERPDDIPGWLIPSLYFDYVRAGRASPLRGVFRHNAEDVLSLAGVLASVARVLHGDALDPDDAASAARWWEAERQSERAMALYRGALPWLEGGDDWAWAASRHAALCRRAGFRSEAAPLWARLWDAGDRRAGLALAKHLEHAAREYARAAAVVIALLRRCEAAERDALELRLARIRRKADAHDTRLSARARPTGGPHRDGATSRR